MKLVPFQALYPNQSLIASPDLFFGSVKAKFPEYKNSGFFNELDEESIFIYQLKTKSKVHRGIITCTDIKDFTAKKVLKHENTIAVKEQKMMNLMLQNRAMIKPVLLAYDRVESIDDFIQSIIDGNKKFLKIEFEETGEIHTLWKVSDSKLLSSLSSLFDRHVPKSYIADGHHRVKTCQLLIDSNKQNEAINTDLKSVLTIYFSWDQLNVFDYNRCIDAFQNISPLKFIAEVSRYCKVKPIKSARRPSKKHEMTMLMYGEWYRLKWKKSILAKHKNEAVLFDTYLLNKYILDNILGITDVREDSRLKYLDGVVGVDGLEDLVEENENRVGFCMFPIESENIVKIADQEKTLPPKSTWFEPRIKNGILVKSF